MNAPRSFQRIAGICAGLTTLLIIGNVVTLFASVNNDAGAFSEAALILPMGANAARLFHVSMVLDVLAYFSFAPVAVLCWPWRKNRGEGLASLFRCAG